MNTQKNIPTDIDYKTQRLDHLGIVAGISQEIDLVAQIDQAIGDTDRKVSVGEAALAMVLNALGFTGRALYLMPEYMSKKPIDLLIRPGLAAEDFNDDSLGRALDLLFEKGTTEVFAKVASHAMDCYGIKHRFVHLDSSSLSVHGEYKVEDNDPEVIEITYGYSKDHRPDLKQALVSLITSHRSEIPLWLEALSGNTSDTKSFPETIYAYLEQLGNKDQPYFVIDSKFYTAENVKTLFQGKWISRVPATIKKCQQLIAETNKVDMQPAKADGYFFKEYPVTYGEVPQRWLVVFSEASYQQGIKSLNKKIEKKANKAEKVWKQLCNQSFSCQADARKAVEQLAEQLHYHQVEMAIEPKYGYSRPGRPPKGAQPEVLGYQVNGKITKDVTAIEVAKQRKGKFVIATNELDQEALPAEEILSEYKAQGVSVERGFRFLKDPMFFADSLFLKNPARIMALIMIMGLALLIYALAECKLREVMQQHQETIPNQVGKPTDTPTLRRIFQMFEGIDVLLICSDAQVLDRQVLNLQPVHLKILFLLGNYVKKCYLLEN